jgi:hypothetical protein
MSWTEQRGSRYRGMYRDDTGHAHSAGTSTSRRKAKQLAEEAEAKIRRGTWTDPNAGALLFSVYFTDHWLPNRVNELNTTNTYQCHYNAPLKDAFGDIRTSTTSAGASSWSHTRECRRSRRSSGGFASGTARSFTESVRARGSMGLPPCRIRRTQSLWCGSAKFSERPLPRR